MKKLFSLFFFFSCFQCQAQSEVVQQVLEPQTFYLNSATNLMGNTREVLTFQLPPNTVRWYYSFSATREKENVQTVQNRFDLLSKLSRLIDKTGTTANALSLIGRPPGSDYCDVYLLADRSSMTVFENKEDNLGSTYSYDREGSRENLVSGVVEVNAPLRTSGWQYLGFRNKDLSHGININVQIVAVVKQALTTNSWTKEQKETLFNSFKSLMNANGGGSVMSTNESDKLIGCILTNVTSQYSPEQLTAYANYEIQSILEGYVKTCNTDLG